jgi:Tfp pilus assembly protein FimT
MRVCNALRRTGRAPKGARLTRVAGITFIEVSVVVLILAVMAATVMPRLVNLKRGDDVRKFRTDVLTSIKTARTTAISSGQTVQLRFEDGSNTVQIVRQEAEDEVMLRRNAAPDGVSGDAYRVGTNTVSAGDFALSFYSDGTSEQGGIQFRFDAATETLWIERDGTAEWRDGELPEPQLERWPAGELEQRT